MALVGQIEILLLFMAAYILLTTSPNGELDYSINVLTSALLIAVTLFVLFFFIFHGVSSFACSLVVYVFPTVCGYRFCTRASNTGSACA